MYLKMGDINYFNYAISEDMINEIYNSSNFYHKQLKKKYICYYNKIVPFYELIS